LLTELFAELRRVTELLSSSRGDIARAHVATVRGLSRLIEDVATEASLPQQAPLHLEAVVAETIEYLAPVIEEQAVKIALERHCLHEPVVFADRERAQHLLLLLLGVVLEQCTPGDTITISFRSSRGLMGVSIGAVRLLADSRISLVGTLAARHSWQLAERPGGEARLELMFDSPRQEAVPFSSSASGFVEDNSRFDESRLARLMGGLPEEGVRRLRASFLETAQRMSASLSATQPVSQDQMVAHSLKGASAMVGADVLAELCGRLENQLADTHSTELASLIAAIRKEVGWLEKRLARPIEPEGDHPGTPAAATTLNLLVVDDDPFVRSALAVMLGHLTSKEVVVCASAEEALTAVGRFTEAEPLDAVVCDLRMPQVDGVTFIRRLAEAQYRGAVIVVSVADVRLRQSVERLARSLGLQVVASLAKPASSGQLASALARVQEGLRKARRGAKPASVLKAPRWTEQDLRAAIQDGGVRPYYQPKVSLRTGQVVGVEALARWIHPEFGVISPAAFLPMAARVGLMDDLLVTGVEHSTEVLLEFPQLSVAVNLEASTACDDQAVGRLMKVIQERQINPERLVFELTETEVDGDPRRITEMLARLQLRGFCLAIDDFGTGRSTHQRLADIPFTELKIDRQFVREGCREEAARAVVESSVVLARRLKMTTTAEGVETADELAFVRRSGCDAVQGYFFSPPLPFEELKVFLTSFVPVPKSSR
jgi:EAL domain-containing protein (putative c-di-GMP-specific phosphodiesterase class I)/CheY-like chemotaxis protein